MPSWGTSIPTLGVASHCPCLLYPDSPSGVQRGQPSPAGRTRLWFLTPLPSTAEPAEGRGVHSPPEAPAGLAPPASSLVPAPDSLPQLCSPALAGVQIPSSLLSLGLGKQSGFLRFLTTLLPEHKDKELFISPLPSVFLRSAELQMPLGITVISRAYAHLPSLLPCPSHPSSPVSPNTTCKSSHVPLSVIMEFQAHPLSKYGRDGSARFHTGTAAERGAPSLSSVSLSPWQALCCHPGQQPHRQLWEVFLHLALAGEFQRASFSRPICTPFGSTCLLQGASNLTGETGHKP